MENRAFYGERFNVIDVRRKLRERGYEVSRTWGIITQRKGFNEEGILGDIRSAERRVVLSPDQEDFETEEVDLLKDILYGEGVPFRDIETIPYNNI